VYMQCVYWGKDIIQSERGYRVCVGQRTDDDDTNDDVQWTSSALLHVPGRHTVAVNLA